MPFNLKDIYTRVVVDLVQVEKPKYSVLEIEPSMMTSNTHVKWMIAEFSRLYKPLIQRIDIDMKQFKINITPELTVWWEVILYKGKIRFFLIVPDKGDIKDSLTRYVMKTWKRANVREVSEPLPMFNPEYIEITRLSLQHNSLLSLETKSTPFSPLDSMLNAKYYLKDNDVAILQVGMTPLGSDWNTNAKDVYEGIKKSGIVPRKKGTLPTKGDILLGVLKVIGIIAEEVANFIADFIIPGWKDDNTMKKLNSNVNGELVHVTASREKIRSDVFKTSMRIIVESEDAERRKSISRAMASGFDPLEADNKLVEISMEGKKKGKELARVINRTQSTNDVLGTTELAKFIQVPDKKAQAEHYNELSLVQHRGESDVPKEIFEESAESIPFAKYQDTDGHTKTVYFKGENKNLLCMPRVVIGEPGTGKTTFAQNLALSAFSKGYGVVMVDGADGKMVQRVLDRIEPHKLHKVKIIDFTNTKYPIGLGWNEIFYAGNLDITEDALVEELVLYIELVSGTPLNMRARQWVENAVKAVFVTPEATLLDVESMLNNSDFREKVIPTIEDPELRADWERYHTILKPEERKTIYDEAFRRLSPVMRKKSLKNFILQKPKKDEQGNYLVDFRKWMDEGYLVLIKATEMLTEPIQTALVAFVIAKFNLAMISREDITNEDDRHPCFLILDEPDHYIKGSDRWRNMLTRFRKYRCGLIFMFHGWQQLTEADKNLPKIIRKSGPHYIIFQTDEDNLLELKSVIEPEFKIPQLAKGMPQHHAIIRLKMYGEGGDVVPAFMAESLGRTEDLYKYHNNDHLYDGCAKELGRPKAEVMNDIFRYRNNSEFVQDIMTVIDQDELDLDKIPLAELDEVDEDRERMVRRRIEYEVGNFIQDQIDKGDDPDYELVEHMDEILGGDTNE